MLKAIQTRYKGYHFRSRLEARWAVFFDVLGLAWDYEIEGFDLGDAGLYLPDFWLRERNFWIEIKGKDPTDEEKRKGSRLTNLSGNPVLIVSGTPEEETIGIPEIPSLTNFGKLGVETFSYLVWCELSCHWIGGGVHPQHDASKFNTCPRIRNAYAEARAARFEHGETPNHPTTLHERRKVSR